MKDRIRTRPLGFWSQLFTLVCTSAELTVSLLGVIALAGIVIFLLIMNTGCGPIFEEAPPLGDEGTSADVQTFGFDPRCNVDIPCHTPSDGGASGDGGSAASDESSSGSEGDDGSSSGAAGSDDSSSEGGDSNGMYGPCDEGCMLAMPSFPSGCVCTSMCESDDDCYDGVCPPDLHWCVMLDCNEGQVLEDAYAPAVEPFCVWPS